MGPNIPSRVALPLLGSNQDSPDPEPSRAGLFGGHHVRKWLPAKHRRPQGWKLMPGLARRNACKMLVESSGDTLLNVGQESPTGDIPGFASSSSSHKILRTGLDWSAEFEVRPPLRNGSITNDR